MRREVVKVDKVSTPKPAQAGPPLRALAMVLIALAILFAGLGAASLGGSESEETAATSSTTSVTAKPGQAMRTTTAPVAPKPGSATTTGPATTSASVTTTAATTSASGADTLSVPVRVFNNSSVSGLAGETAGELTSAGWTVAETGNYSDTTIAETTVYYGTSAVEKEAALEIAAALGATAKPRPAALTSTSAGVIVIVTAAG